MPVLPNARHELFAQAVAKGEAAGAAYAGVYSRAKAATAGTKGPALLRSEAVRERVAELQAAAAGAVVFEIEDALRFCVEVIMTPAGAVDEGHRLCQEYSATPTREGMTCRYKMPGKLEALEKIIKLRGWYAPEKKELSGKVTVCPEVLAALDNLGIKST